LGLSVFGYKVRVKGFMAYSLAVRDKSLGFRVQRLRVQGSGLEVEGLKE